jgi:hypothetical protein
MTVIAMLGSKALWLLYLWLLSAIVASYLSNRKGYGEKPGLATGLLLHLIGVVIWLVWPPRPDSKWRTVGAFKRSRAERRPGAEAPPVATAGGGTGGGGGSSSET